MKQELLSAALAATVAAGMAAVPIVASATPQALSAPPTTGLQPALDEPRFRPVDRAAAIDAAQRDVTATAHELGLSPQEALVVADVVRDADGSTHVRYDRTFAGLPVIGGDLVVHSGPTGAMRDADFATRTSLGTVRTITPTVSAQAAAGEAARSAQLRDARTAPKLVVYGLDGRPRVAWETTVTGTAPDGGPVREVVYVDARTGERINGWSLLETAEGTGRSLYSGRVPVTTVHKRKSDTFLLKDAKRGNHRTYDAGDSKISGTGKLFTDRDNVWGNSAKSSRQSVAVDAHYGAAVTWRYFKDTHSRNGIRNDGVAAYSRVHFGKNYDNAFWSDACFCMTYGDGGSVFKPLASLDVAGHEMTHGITSNTAGLYYFGESGGLSEATSDIFGALVEFYADNAKDRGDYYIGEKVMQDGTYLRRMDNPKLDGVSYNCYTAGMGVDDVHHTSGPGNHFFYLLAEGSGAKTIGGRAHNSPTCNGSKVNGIGRAAAGKVWYRALNVYFLSTTDYKEARDATIRAARDLYGNNSAKCKTVVKAWNAVKVPAGVYTCGGSTLPKGPNLVDNPSFESGKSGWTKSPGVIISNDSSGIARSGKWWAELGNNGSEVTESLSQSITIPAASKVTLSFYLLGYTRDCCDFDTFKVQVTPAGGSPKIVKTIGNSTADLTYHRQTVNMSAYAGKRVTLKFLSDEDFLTTTGWLIDDIAVRTG